MANISDNKINLSQGQSYIEGKCYNGSKKLNFKNTQLVNGWKLSRYTLIITYVLNLFSNPL